MCAAADRFEVVAGFDAKTDGAAFHFQHFGAEFTKDGCAVRRRDHGGDVDDADAGQR